MKTPSRQLYLVSLLVLLMLASVFAANSTNTTAPQQNTTSNVTQAPQVSCSSVKCDKSCVKCSDKQCHLPGFSCTEEISLEKYFPTTVNTGVTQLNIVLNNTGTVNLENIYAIVTGDGIETLDKIPLEKLNAGGRDYVFAKINSTKPGIIDIVIKLYVGDVIKNKFVDQITVIAPKVVVENNTEKINVTEITKNLEMQKQRYNQIEQIYQDKKQQGYPVDIIYDKLKESYGYLTDAQSNLLQGDFKKVNVDLGIISSGLDDIQTQLSNSKKAQQSFSDQLKSNLLLYGSIAAAIISIFTAYKMVHSSVDKEKIKELHQRIFARKKKDKKASKKKKAKAKEKLAEQP